MKTFLMVTILSVLGATSGFGQTATPADTTARPPAPPVRYARASWTSDRVPLQVGDLITVVVDEQTAAREQVSTVATGSRSQRAGLNGQVAVAARLGPLKGFGTSLDANSRDVGEAHRVGDLTAVITVRVTEIEPSGVAHISGTRSVMIDGRKTELLLEGIARPEDLTADNLLSSDRVANAVITYRGRKIGPRTGILGKILSILWP
ncbi:MAG: flagellar basal body L-ring protein FlgH [Gemmatimonadota bacterium]